MSISSPLSTDKLMTGNAYNMIMSLHKQQWETKKNHLKCKNLIMQHNQMCV